MPGYHERDTKRDDVCQFFQPVSVFFALVGTRENEGWGITVNFPHISWNEVVRIPSLLTEVEALEMCTVLNEQWAELFC